MDTAPNLHMTADEFIAWSTEQPKGMRYELSNGEIVEMASERARHAKLKGEVFHQLRTALGTSGLPCEVFPDGMAVRIDANTVYEPDVAVRCGPTLDPDAVIYDDPVILVEVSSPTTRHVDAGLKLTDYFRLPSLRHYLIVRSDRPAVIHHARGEGDTIQTRLVSAGPISLDPPGLTLQVEALYPA